MKKLIYLLLLLGVFSACSSDDNEPKDDDYYIRFKIDGNQVHYDAPLFPITLYFDAESSHHVAAALVPKPGSDGTKDFISFFVWNESDFTTGVTYQMQQPITYNGFSLPRIHLTWADSEGTVFNAVLLKSQYPNLTITNDAQVRFTEIEQDVVKGTFSGIIIGTAPGTPNNPEIQVTEGEFRLKRSNTPSA